MAKSVRRAIAAGLLLGACCAIELAGGESVTLSNLALPRDQNGDLLITGEASVMKFSGTYYFYFNNWGDCPGVDCCNSSAGCASCCFDNPPQPYLPGCENKNNGSDPYGLYHTIQAYSTTDFKSWNNLGVALPLSSRKPGILFRPCVVWNAKTKLFLMWFEDRGPGEPGYTVATSATPEGPFQTAHIGVTMPGKGRIGDFNIFVDDDATAWHIRTGFNMVKLNDEYTGPAEPAQVASLRAPGEGPTMFKFNGTYWVTTGNGCCACLGGTNVYVLSAPHPLGPWTTQGDIGSIPDHKFDPHSPHNYVTRAQGSAAFMVGDSVIYLGNQWNSGLNQSPPGPRNHDLLYWDVFSFVPGPAPAPPSPVPPIPPPPKGVLTCWSEIQVHKGGSPVTFSCPAGSNFDKVDFAAFGTPSGSCADLKTMTHNSSCDSESARSIITKTCIGKTKCTINPSTSVFGDPCIGTVKRLLVDLHCSSISRSAAHRSQNEVVGIHIEQLAWRDSITLDL